MMGPKKEETLHCGLREDASNSTPFKKSGSQLYICPIYRQERVGKCAKGVSQLYNLSRLINKQKTHTNELKKCL